ncbi:hypothetical protein BCR34DRAFT_602132 [Clohesyomyces aquaticus]|uniref:Uncharacterized protein n=1 Tax=Clohesyomyces aquaticus TaxID=1231657 RepID=A0A1Y1ZJI8_9PLEO|nr:hypothetical protein BCR34DRAFT_602132 [Clohesyomyces aquaticus]
MDILRLSTPPTLFSGGSIYDLFNPFQFLSIHNFLILSSPPTMQAGGGEPPPPPSPASGRGQRAGQRISLHRDGRTKATALLSPGILGNPCEEWAYLVFQQGLWILASAQEARQYFSYGFRVIDPRSGLDVTDWTKPIAPPSTAIAFGNQIENVDSTIDAVEADINRETPPKKGKAKEDSRSPKTPDNKGSPKPCGHRRSHGGGAGAAGGVAD